MTRGHFTLPCCPCNVNKAAGPFSMTLKANCFPCPVGLSTIGACTCILILTKAWFTVMDLMHVWLNMILELFSIFAMDILLVQLSYKRILHLARRGY